MTEAFRLLMTTDAVGGVWTHAVDLAGGLAAWGVQTTLVVLGPPPSAAQTGGARAIPGLELSCPGLPLDWLAEDEAAAARSAAGVAGIARAQAVNLIHLNSPPLAALAEFPVPVVGACHSCLATWWDAIGEGALPADFGWRVALLQRGYAACDALVAPSAAFAAATAARHGLSRAPSVVRNGRDDAGIGDPLAQTLPDFAFTAGRLWDAGKNIARLDAAAAKLSLPVFAAGDTEGPDGSGVTLRHLRPLGRLEAPAIAEWLRARPIFVSTARYEPFGLAVLEAAQAGCALVLSDIPTFRELWSDAARFVPADDAGAIAAALAEVAAHPEERARLGERARERAAHYSAAAMTAGMMRLYRPLLRRAAA